MSAYLKYKPAWLQLMVFGSLVFGIFLITSLAGLFIISKVFDVAIMDLAGMDFSRPGMILVAKWVQVLSSLGMFLIPAVVFAYLSDPYPLRFSGMQKPDNKVYYLLAILIMIGGFPMIAWLGELNQNMHLPGSMKGFEDWARSTEAKANELLKAFLTMNGVGDLMVNLIVLAVIPAVAEELFFRGILQRIFIKIFKAPWTGIIVTAIIFSALHGQFLGFIPRFVLGVGLGAIYWFSGSLWPAILAHFLNNGLQILGIYFFPSFLEADPNVPLWLGLGSTAVFIGLMAIVVKRSNVTLNGFFANEDEAYQNLNP